MNKFYKTNYTSPLGNITLASDGTNLLGLWFIGQKYYTDTIQEELLENNNLEIFNKTKQWLDEYFMGHNPSIDKLPLAPIGNNFRKRIWQILCDIPYGSVMTYGQIANIIAKEQQKEKMSAQAVGNAISHNPISIIIPCHRVVGKNGNLTGYAGGIDKKISLLKLEGIDILNLFKAT